MELWNGCNDEQNLDGQGEEEIQRARMGASLGCFAVSAGQRYDRFEPITVRAATRVLQLQQAGVVSASEARFYLRELLTMDLHAGPGALKSLTRMAQRHAVARPSAGQTGSGPQRRHAELTETPVRASRELSAAA